MIDKKEEPFLIPEKIIIPAIKAKVPSLHDIFKDFSKFEYLARMTEETIRKIKNGEITEHKDIEWEYHEHKYREGDILQILKWPFALYVENYREGDMSGEGKEPFELNMGVINILEMNILL